MASRQVRRNKSGDIIGYTYRVRIEGRDISKTFKTDAEGIEWKRITEGKIAGKLPEPSERSRTITVAELLDLYENRFGKHHRGYQKAERYLYLQWKREPFADYPACSLTTNDLYIWRDIWWQELGKAPSTVNNCLNLLGQAYNKASAFDLVLTNPCQAVERITNNPGRYIVLEDEDRERLFKAVAEYPDRRLYYSAEIAVRTAMRQGEIRGIHRDYIDMTHHYVHLPKTKNLDKRDVPMMLGVDEIFRRALDELREQPGGWLFGDPDKFAKAGGYTHNQVSQAWREVVSKLDPPLDVTFHDLRHLACTDLAEFHTDCIDLARTTGHKSPQMLLRYFNPSPKKRAADLRKREAKVRAEQAAELRQAEAERLAKEAAEAQQREAELAEEKRKREEAERLAEEARQREAQMEMARDMAQEAARFYRLRDLRSKPPSPARDAEIARLEAETAAYHAKYPDARPSADLDFERREQEVADEMAISHAYRERVRELDERREERRRMGYDDLDEHDY